MSLNTFYAQAVEICTIILLCLQHKIADWLFEIHCNETFCWV